MKALALSLIALIGVPQFCGAGEPRFSEMKFCGRDYELKHVTAEGKEGTTLHAYVFSPSLLALMVGFESEFRESFRDEKLPPASAADGALWTITIQSTKQTVMISDGTLLFIERVGSDWAIAVLRVPSTAQEDKDVFAIVEAYRSKMLRTAM
jgi:hypothetical protein